MTTIKAMKELARASKQINNNPNMRIQVAERHDGKGFNTYRCYGNDYFQDDKDETTIGFTECENRLDRITQRQGRIKNIIADIERTNQYGKTNP